MGKGSVWHPPREINPNPPSGRLPRAHPGQGSSGSQPEHGGNLNNLKGIVGRTSGEGAAAARGGNANFDRNRP